MKEMIGECQIIKWCEEWKGNNIGAEGTRMISEGLESNSTLTKLDASGEEKRMKEATDGNSNDVNYEQGPMLE